MQHDDRIRIVYRPPTSEEGHRRTERANRIVGTPFIQLPGKPPQHQVLFTASTGDKIRVEQVEMVFNDAMLMDAISDWGKDGPLYKDTLTSPIEREIYEYAERAYATVELPPQLRRPDQKGTSDR